MLNKNNVRLDIRISKKELDRWINYLKESGWTVTACQTDDFIYYQSNLDWNYGNVACSCKVNDRWQHYLAMRVCQLIAEPS